MGDDHESKVASIGSINLRMHDGMERVLSLVRYVPNLKRDLISLGMLDNSGFSFKFVNGVLKVLKGAMIKVKGILWNGLYVLLANKIVGDFAIATHKRLEKSLNSTKLILEYAHCNLWRPSKVPIQAKTRYFLSLIDDYSREVYILKHKN